MGQRPEYSICSKTSHNVAKYTSPGQRPIGVNLRKKSKKSRVFLKKKEN